MSPRGGNLRLGVVLDAPLEGWRSMDYIGEMLVQTLKNEHANDVEVSALQPWTPRLTGRLPASTQRLCEAADRLFARCVVYPLAIGMQRFRLDVFHIADHSYAHAAAFLPNKRTGIYCHDLDALRPLGAASGWAPLRRALARGVLRGLQHAAVVFYNTKYVGTQISALGLIDDRKLVHAPLGLAKEFYPTRLVDPELQKALPGGRYLLHVGSGIPRKRLELLFRAFALLLSEEPDLLLVQQGATLTEQQSALVDTLRIRRSLVMLPRLPRKALAHLYRRATLLVLPSESEGFGLPVIEALACGTPVLASEIPALRETGGDAASFCDGADPSVWAQTILRLLHDQAPIMPAAGRIAHAMQFTWSRHAQTILDAYRSLI